MADKRRIRPGAIKLVLKFGLLLALGLAGLELAKALNLMAPSIWAIALANGVVYGTESGLSSRRMRLGALSLWRAKQKEIEAILQLRQAAPCGPSGEWWAVGPDREGDWRVVNPEELDNSDWWRTTLDELPRPTELRWRPYEAVMDMPLIPITAVGLALAVGGHLFLEPWWGSVVMAFSLSLILGAWIWAAVQKAIGASSNHELEWIGPRLSSSDWQPEQAIHLDEPGLLTELRGKGETERLILRQGRLKLEVPCWSPGYPTLKAKTLPAG